MYIWLQNGPVQILLSVLTSPNAITYQIFRLYIFVG